MSSSTQNNQVATWILGGIIILALVLMVSGGLMMLSDSDQTAAGAFDDSVEPVTYLQVSPTPMSVSGAMMLNTPTAVDWSAFMPTPENIIGYTAVEKFGTVAMGSEHPQVTIIEYGAYGCTSCRKVHQDGVLANLMARYGDDVRYVFVAWPVQHNNDPLATEAVLCAMDQGKLTFWAYHNALLDLSQIEFNTYDNIGRFADLAEQVSTQVEMNVETFELCLLEGNYREFVYNLTNMGWRIGLRGTPTFFVNGKMTSSMYVPAMVDDLLSDEDDN